MILCLDDLIKGESTPDEKASEGRARWLCKWGWMHSPHCTCCLISALFLGRHDDASRLPGTALNVVLGEKTSLASGITNHDPSFFRGLHVGLEVTANAISDRDERECFVVKYIPVVGSQFQESFGELVVVVLLLNGVIESGMA
jgi:hypothetical protein